jgi:hypothetical protein
MKMKKKIKKAAAVHHSPMLDFEAEKPFEEILDQKSGIKGNSFKYTGVSLSSQTAA